MSKRNRRKNRKKKNKQKRKQVVNRQSKPKKARSTGNQFGYRFAYYKDESEIPHIKRLMDLDLSEPYSIFTYRYFVNTWPDLCIITYDKERVIAAIICKIEEEEKRPEDVTRGYIAMLVVDREYRKKGLGSELVKRSIKVMTKRYKAEEVVLETEVINHGALRLYENLGFLREKRLCKYYLNGGDAFRLKLLLPKFKR